MKSEYMRFRESLKINFSDLDIDDKDNLKRLMRVGGYRIRKDGTKEEPTQKQLDFAWGHLKRIGLVKEGFEIKMIETIITPKGFKKKQIRDKKTGRILRWE